MRTWYGDADPPEVPSFGVTGWIRVALRGSALAVLILQFATPVAVTSYLLAEKYGAHFLVIERRHVRERKADLEYRYQYQQFLLAKPIKGTPFKRPLCLKQVYPNSSCSAEIRKDSAYLVYKLEIPREYEPQIQALDKMLTWYEAYAEWMKSQNSSTNK